MVIEMKSDESGRNEENENENEEINLKMKKAEKLNQSSCKWPKLKI
jgi:hypothetical protein